MDKKNSAAAGDLPKSSRHSTKSDTESVNDFESQCQAADNRPVIPYETYYVHAYTCPCDLDSGARCNCTPEVIDIVPLPVKLRRHHNHRHQHQHQNKRGAR